MKVELGQDSLRNLANPLDKDRQLINRFTNQLIEINHSEELKSSEKVQSN
jgi:hypothetical protein